MGEFLRASDPAQGNAVGHAGDELLIGLIAADVGVPEGPSAPQQAAKL